MATEISRKYVIPLHRETKNVPRYKRAKRAVSTLKNFLIRHMKSDNIKLGPQLNLLIWSQGMRNPPHKVSVDVIKKDDVVMAELEGFKYPVKAAKAKDLKTKIESGAAKSEKEDKAEKKESAASESKESTKASKKSAEKAAESKPSAADKPHPKK